MIVRIAVVLGKRTNGYFTPVRIVFWCLMVGILGFVALVWMGVFGGTRQRGSDRAHCIMNQRNIQQAVRSFQHGNWPERESNDLKVGDPIEWDRIIGEGLFLEERPECPVHGPYEFLEVFPEVGMLAAPCRDPEHEPVGHEDW